MAAMANMDATMLHASREGTVDDIRSEPTTVSTTQSEIQPNRGLIPLQCSLCTKTKSFSDLSHLLTHVSSKGHLANEFKLRVSGDRSAELALARYSEWFNNYGIKDLLQARQNSRKQKKQRKKRVVTKDDGRTARRTQNNATGRSESIEIKHEQESDDDSNNAYARKFLKGSQMHSWASTESTRACGPSVALSNGYETPPVQDNAGPYYYPESEEGVSKYEPSEDENNCGANFNSLNRSAEPGSGINDSVGNIRLKGTIYPGMDCFDAATEEQKRRRNQRKHPSVLRGMMQSSATVETIEEIFTTDLEWQRSRDVYDSPSVDSSMDEEEVKVSAKKRKPRTAAGPRRVKKANSGLNYFPTAQATSRMPAAPNATPTIRRLTRSAAKRREALHSHGVPNTLDDFDDSHARSPGHTESPTDHRGSHRLPGLALRPGNPNISFVSPTPVLKRPASRLCNGKENNPISFHSSSTTPNPYYNPHSPVTHSSYNPLYVQPRDTIAFRNPYSSYDEDAKSLTVGFQPINSQHAFETFPLSSRRSNSYHPDPNAVDGYDI